MAVNDDQIAYWNGPTGEKWARFQALMDANLVQPSEAALALASPRAGERVLDIGCGAGSTSRDLAALVGPGGHVTAVDVSRPLLDQARSLPNPAHLDFLEADAASHPFAADQDLVFSRFGVMFFEQPVTALAHLRGSLKPGGRMVFVCWRPAVDNEWVTLPLDVAKALVPPPPAADPHAPGPFAFADPQRLRDMLGQAGFAAVEITPFDGHMDLGVSPGDAAFQMVNLGPTARLLRESDAATRQRVEEAVEQAFARRLKEQGDLRLKLACWLVRAGA